MQKQSNTTTILVAPLNWGLGHAARCVPIIKSLLKKKVRVLLASDGAALDLLKKEFPQLPAFSLPGYDVTYPYNSMVVNMLLQFPKIQRAIWEEYKVLQTLITEYDVKIVISDNRFGCYSSKTYNIFITHQLNIIAPFALAEKVIAHWNKNRLRRFDMCWVPDYEEAPGLAGSLSHPSPVEPVRYIGPLSRMSSLDVEKKYDAIAVLSGPEPQRSRLEELILQQGVHLPYRILLVRGKMDDLNGERQLGNVTIVSHLKASELEEAIAASEVVIARTGYTTIMDLVALGKKAILVPTPGQPEQLYLGEMLSESRRFLVTSQGALDLGIMMEEVLQRSTSAKTPVKIDLDRFVNELLYFQLQKEQA